MRELIKHLVKDAPVEPYIRWCVKRSRGFNMPYDLVVNEIYDRQATEVIGCVLDPASNAIDVGCHKGQFLDAFYRHAPHGQHFGFEPIPDMAQDLAARYPAADIQPCALSDQSGTETFFVIPASPALSGLNTRSFVAPGLERKPIPVTVARLDDVIPPRLPIRLIKIDVEGAEGRVISGARETLARNRPYIIFEHGQESSSVFNTTSESIYQQLTAVGLQVSTLRDWLKGGAPLTARQFGRDGGWYYLAHPESRAAA